MYMQVWNLVLKDLGLGVSLGLSLFFIIFVYIFLDTPTAYTREPILTHNSSKDAD